MDLLQFLAFLFVLLLSGTGVTGTLRTSLDPSLEIYKKMFEVKRREQLLALKNLAQMNDVHQQYKILDVMLKGLFKVLEDSRTVLIASDVLPDGPFPQDEKLKDAFSQVVENTAFFGDVVLRFPKIVHHYFDQNSNWNLLIRWGISFCNQSGVFDQGPHSPILSLMAQELGISEKDSDFQNPFKVDHAEEPYQSVCWPLSSPEGAGRLSALRCSKSVGEGSRETQFQSRVITSNGRQKCGELWDLEREPDSASAVPFQHRPFPEGPEGRGKTPEEGGEAERDQKRPPDLEIPV
nr:coiled-coil domain-containing protein 134 isoform X1 [Manis javanica]